MIIKTKDTKYQEWSKEITRESIHIYNNTISWYSVEDKLPDDDISEPPTENIIYYVLISNGWRTEHSEYFQNKNSVKGEFYQSYDGLGIKHNEIQYWCLTHIPPDEKIELKNRQHAEESIW